MFIFCAGGNALDIGNYTRVATSASWREMYELQICVCRCFWLQEIFLLWIQIGVSSSQACCFPSLSSSGGGSWAESSWESQAAESEATRQNPSLVRHISAHKPAKQASVETDLWLFTLHTADAVRTVHNCVLWHDLTRVDLAACADDTSAGQDHISPKISLDSIWAKRYIFVKKTHYRNIRIRVGWHDDTVR